MTASQATETDWHPQPCPAPQCGAVLQAEVGFCPFCGTAQTGGATASAEASKPAATESPAVTAATDTPTSAAGPAPSLPPELPPLPPLPPEPAPPQIAPVAEAESVADAPADVPPDPTPVGGTAAASASVPRTRRRWHLLVAGLVGIVVLAYWLRPAPEPDWVGRCDALSNGVNDALGNGELDRADAELAQARAICQDTRLDALAPLAAQLSRSRELATTCSAVKQRADAALERKRPRQAQSLLAQQKDNCSAYPPYAAAVEHAAKQIRQAATLLDDGNRQLQAGDLAGAEQSLAQALAADTQANGIEHLRTALATAQRQQAAALAPVATPTRNNTPAVATSADALVADLLNDAQAALARKNYAEAKAQARSALRLAPGNRAASNLLQRAESAERQALQDIVID